MAARKRPAVQPAPLRPARSGRKPRGLNPGEQVRDYPPMTWRIPPDTRRKLLALALMRQLPAWRLLVRLVDEAIEALPANERGLLGRLVEQAEKMKGE